MPIDYSAYPPNWLSEIRPRILKRANDQCEWCGVRNKAFIIRPPFGGFVYVDESSEYVKKNKVTKVVLTIAHLGTPKPDGSQGDKHDKMDTRDENLAALCQACHLSFDLSDHIRHRKENRSRKLGLISLDLKL